MMTGDILLSPGLTGPNFGQVLGYYYMYNTVNQGLEDELILIRTHDHILLVQTPLVAKMLNATFVLFSVVRISYFLKHK